MTDLKADRSKVKVTTKLISISETNSGVQMAIINFQFAYSFLCQQHKYMRS